MLRRVSEPLSIDAKLSVVGIDDLLRHARISDVDDGEELLLEQLIEAAFDFLHGPDGWLNGYCILKERFELGVCRVDRGPVALEARPYAGTVTFERRGDDGAYVVLDPATYSIGFNAFYAVVGIFGPALLAPIAYRSDPAAFRIQFDAGHATADDVPASLRLAIKMLASHWYANREATSSDNRAVPKQIELGLKALCRRYRLASDHS